MKKFKISWTEIDEDGERWAESRVFEALDEDAACNAWELDVELYVETTGIDDCVEVTEHPLENSKIHVEMLDGNIYMVPVMFIAKHRVARGCLTLEEVLDDFLSDNSRISSYASQHIKWSEVQRVAFYVEKSYTAEQFQKCWEEATTIGGKIDVI